MARQQATKEAKKKAIEEAKNKASDIQGNLASKRAYSNLIPEKTHSFLKLCWEELAPDILEMLRSTHFVTTVANKFFWTEKWQKQTDSYNERSLANMMACTFMRAAHVSFELKTALVERWKRNKKAEKTSAVAENIKKENMTLKVMVVK
ncbi:hypothetical protein Fot_06230 [Forsythia ovata]|uniref:Uncharacterized protein n=1 Tax=Forsythia ovata TaxID=205694 RepID=A0ABD1WV92_9LAMI